MKLKNYVLFAKIALMLLISIEATSYLKSENVYKLDDKRIKLKSQIMSVKEVIDLVQSESGFTFSYNPKDIPLEQQIEFSSNQLSLEELLNEVKLKVNIDYVQNGKYIILKKVELKSSSTSKFTISGYIKDKSNGEYLIGANAYIKETYQGTVSNAYGFYSLTLESGEHNIVFSFIGYNPKMLTVDLTENKKIDIELESQSKQLEEVVITAVQKTENITSTKMGNVNLNSATVKKVPVLLGETDPLKVIKLLPGVQPAGETSSNFSVRGGDKDQNLILLDEATVYNASHVLGLFSVFNNDAIKNIEFYKGNIPARYGGRLSSVLDIKMNEGNTKSISGKGGIGVISSRLTVDVPIKKDIGSVTASARRTYLDYFNRFSKDKDSKNSRLHFHDLNLKANYKLNENNRIYLSMYQGRDMFGDKSNDDEFNFNWGNITSTLRWNHQFNEKLFSNISMIFSTYDYQIKNDFKDKKQDIDGNVVETRTSIDWGADLTDYSTKADFGYYLNPENTVRFGAFSTYHVLDPGTVKFTLDNKVYKFSINDMHALENAAYLENEQKLSSLVTLNYGLRYSNFNNIYKKPVYTYNGDHKIKDTLTYHVDEIYKSFGGLEPRFGATYLLNEISSIKVNYSRNYQYLQQASASSSGSPLDSWFPSSLNVKPQLADQVSFGYFRNFSNNRIEFSLETYYKHMQNQIDFKDHAMLLMNEHIENQLRFGNGRAYGMELLLKKNSGKLQGWTSYTLSKAERKIKGINDGQYYLSPYDRTHNFSIVMMYELGKRWEISANWVYLTGQPFTSPAGWYEYEGVHVPVYSGRNKDRLPNYHRLDLGLTLKSKENPNKLIHGSWNLSVYNVYNNDNPLFLYFTFDDKGKQSKAKLYYLPVIPAITYNFKF